MSDYLADLKESLLDFMGKPELAANLFRLTQTEEKIKNENIRGQTNLENAAEKVGQVVREAMINTGGVAPESLRLSKDIKGVRKSLKQANKRFKKLDEKKKK